MAEVHLGHMLTGPKEEEEELLTFPPSSLPSTLSSVPSTTLDKQLFLNTFTVTSGEMWCHEVIIHID
jgi:hypothetical protein